MARDTRTRIDRAENEMLKAELTEVKAELAEVKKKCKKLREIADEKSHEAGLYAKRMGEAQRARCKALKALDELRATDEERRGDE